MTSFLPLTAIEIHQAGNVSMIAHYAVPGFMAILWGIYILIKDRMHFRYLTYGSAALFALGTVLVCNGFFYIHVLSYSFPLQAVYLTSGFLFPTLYYCHVKELTTITGLQKSDLWIFAPPILIVGILALIGTTQTPEQIYDTMRLTWRDEPLLPDFYETAPFANLSWFIGDPVLYVLGVYMVGVCIWAMFKKRRYITVLKTLLSNKERDIIETRNSYVCEIGFLFAASTLFYTPSALYMGEWSEIPIEIFTVTFISFGASFIARLSLGANQVKDLLESNETSGLEKNELEKAYKYIEDFLSSEEGQTRIKRSTEIIPVSAFDVVYDEKLFLDQRITIFSLAKKLNVDFQSLSKSIHYHFHCNFSEFIHTKRLQYAKELIESGLYSDINIVANKAGFFTVRNFISDYKTTYGVDPNAYLQLRRRQRKTN